VISVDPVSLIRVFRIPVHVPASCRLLLNHEFLY
jgi:hypothetical protein